MAFKIVNFKGISKKITCLTEKMGNFAAQIITFFWSSDALKLQCFRDCLFYILL